MGSPERTVALHQAGGGEGGEGRGREMRGMKGLN